MKSGLSGSPGTRRPVKAPNCRFGQKECESPLQLSRSLDRTMPGSYPNDADGDALRNAEESGADMSLPMVIDFSVDVPDEHTARRVAEIVEAYGFDPSIYEDDDSGSWS